MLMTNNQDDEMRMETSPTIAALDRSHIILKLNRPLQWRSLILQTKLFLSTRIMPAKVSDSVWAKSKFRGFLNLPLHASAAQLGFDIVIKCGYSFGMDRGA